MSEQPDYNKRIIGYILPIGNGAVGKTSMVLNLTNNQEKLATVKKSTNMEFEYGIDDFIDGQKCIRIIHHYLVPPGQRRVEASLSHRSFEDIMEIYRFMVKRIDVCLLSYKLISVDTFHDLEHWLSSILELCNPKTEFIMVGTFLDQDSTHEVTRTMIDTGKNYIQSLVKAKHNEWRGSCRSMEISNVNQTNIDTLKREVSLAILRSQNGSIIT
jgi:GTPase SAR1 family protein